MSLLHNPRKLSGLTLSCINLSNARLMTIHMNITQSHRLRSMLSLYLRQSDVALCSWSGGQRRRQNLGEEVEWREAKEEMPPYRLPLRLFGGLLAAHQEPAQDMERVVLIPCVEPLRHTCLPASEVKWSSQCSNRNMAVIYTIFILTLINYLFNFDQLKKHCQRHNRPEGWVHITSLLQLQFQLRNLDQILC